MGIVFFDWLWADTFLWQIVVLIIKHIQVEFISFLEKIEEIAAEVDVVWFFELSLDKLDMLDIIIIIMAQNLTDTDFFCLLTNLLLYQTNSLGYWRSWMNLLKIKLLFVLVRQY